MAAEMGEDVDRVRRTFGNDRGSLVQPAVRRRVVPATERPA